MKTFVINLASSTDRWKKISIDLKKENIKPIRFNAINGRLLDDNYLDNNTSTMSRYFGSIGFIGCFLSHRDLWNKIIKSNDNIVMILEDDVKPVKKFWKKFNKIYPTIPKDWDIILLGCHVCCNPENKCHGIVDNIAKIFSKKKGYKINENVFVPSVFGGTHAYIINKRGAYKSFKELSKASYSLDVALSSSININIYAMWPKLMEEVDLTSGSSTIATSNNGSPLDKIIIDKKSGITLGWYMQMPLYNIGKIKITMTTLCILFFIVILLSIVNKNPLLLWINIVIIIFSIIVIYLLVWYK